MDNIGIGIYGVTSERGLDSESTNKPPFYNINGNMLLTYGAINKNNEIRIQQVYALHERKIFQRFRWESYNSYSSWEQIFPDYSAISLNSIGYIIFTNKISILWGRTYDNQWKQNQSGTYHQVISLPINITNQYRQFVSSQNLFFWYCFSI